MGNLKKFGTLEIFESLLATVTLAIFICLLPNYNWYFGSDSYFILNKFFNGSPKSLILDLLTYFPSLSLFVFFLLVMANSATILGYRSFSLRVAKAISIYWLHQRLWVIGDGGMNLLVLSHLFLCLKDLPFLKDDTRESVNDSLLWLLKGQFLLIYITAFFSKMSGAAWVQGEALGIVVQIDKFQSNFLHFIFEQVPVIEKTGTIGVVLLQGLLPLGLCFGRGRIRDFTIALGISMHLGIAIHMGLVGFSIIMIAHYVLFFEGSSLGTLIAMNTNKLAQSLFVTLLLFNFLSLCLIQDEEQQTEMLNISKSTYTKSDPNIPYASITKLFTLSLVDTLQKNGKIDIDTPFQTPAGQFKIRALASFQSSVVDLDTNRRSISDFNWKNWNQFFKVQQGYRGYSNFSYVLIQYILESRLEKSLTQLFEENLHLSGLKIQNLSKSDLPFNLRTLAAFGLEGPLSALKILSKNLSDKGFCLESNNLCIRGAANSQGHYFLGDQGENQLYVIISKSGLTAMNTWHQPVGAGF
jgi:hypothetical protein